MVVPKSPQAGSLLVGVFADATPRPRAATIAAARYCLMTLLLPGRWNCLHHITTPGGNSKSHFPAVTGAIQWEWRGRGASRLTVSTKRGRTYHPAKHLRSFPVRRFSHELQNGSHSR